MEDNGKDINSNIKSETIDKAIDKLAVPMYNDIAQKSAQGIGNTAGTVVDFVHNFFLYPMQKYNIYAKSKLTNYANELEHRAQAIPKENCIQPRVNILGPTVEGLKYNLDEEFIKEMFTNILISEMDNRKQRSVLPSYIEVVKQLSHDDASFLQFVKTKNDFEFPILKLKINYIGKNCFDYISHNLLLITHDGSENQWIEAIVIDNLVRLQLIELTYIEADSDNSIYSKAFEEIRDNDYGLKDGDELGYKKGLLRVTDFGKNFMNICM